jgi:hypothetical protein
VDGKLFSTTTCFGPQVVIVRLALFGNISTMVAMTYQVNWRNAPAYKLAQLFSKKANHLTPIDLISKLNHTPLAPHLRLASLDISSLYTNISIKETQSIFTNILPSTPPDTRRTY